MSETRTTFDPFEGKTVQIRNDLTLRLRGKYANGPTLPNGEPEFGWREFPTPPIQHEAADEIERLRGVLEGIAEYWNGSPTSAVNAIETVVERAEAALSQHNQTETK